MTVLVVALLMFLGTGLPYGEGPDVLYMHGQWEMTEGHFDPGFPGGSGPAIWYRVALPADLGVDPPRANLIRAYRFRLDVPESFDLDELLGIHLGPVQAAAQAWLNGSLVGQTGDVDGLDVPAFRESRVYALPAGVLHHGVNEVVLRIRNVIPHAHGPRGNHPAVGPLAKMYRMGRIESMPTLVLGCMLLGLGLFHLILTQADLRAHGLRSFALATAAMGVMSLLEVRWLFGLTLPQAVVERMLHMIVFSVPVLLFNFFCSSMVQAKNCPTLYRVSHFLLFYPALCVLMVIIPFGHQAFYVWDFMINDRLILMLAVAAVIAVFYQVYRREADSLMLAGATGLFAVTVIVEVLADQYHLFIPRRLHLVGLLLLTLGMASLLARRIGRLWRETRASSRMLADLNANLEERVESRTRELAEVNMDLARSKIITEEQSHSRRELLHVLCHDLANPLTSIQEAVRQLQLDTKHWDILFPVLSLSSQNAVDVIQLVREIQVIEDRPMDLHPVDLQHAVDNAVTMLRSQLDRKQISLEVEVDESLKVIAEPTSLVSSVLSNILINAITFSPSGERIRLQASTRADRIYIRCIDHGIGMPEDIRRSLFDLGKNISRAGTDGEKGTGFGMPMVKKFVTAYGGTIEVQSTSDAASPARGTVVLIILADAQPATTA